jgi:hypothetical protein
MKITAKKADAGRLHPPWISADSPDLGDGREALDKQYDWSC